MAGVCASQAALTKNLLQLEIGQIRKMYLLLPRIEAGMPTICSETCVGRIRYLGVLLYDADKIHEVASLSNEQDLYQAQLDIFLDPHDPKVIKQALQDGVPMSVIESAQNPLSINWQSIGSLLCPCTQNTVPCLWCGMCHHYHHSKRRRSRQSGHGRTDSRCGQFTHSFKIPCQHAHRRR